MRVSDNRLDLWGSTLAWLALVLNALAPISHAAPATVSIGHTGNPLLAPLYAAAESPAAAETFILRKFGSGGDIGYALLAGELDAGFVEPAKALALLRLPGATHLRIIGVLNFPFGSTVVLRKDIKKRLSELREERVAAAEPDCALLHQFKRDAARLGADLSKLRYQYLPFDAMLPALEAGTVDAVVIKGSYAVLAVQAGHNILYQNWEVQEQDECCPAIIAQAEYLLLAHTGDEARITRLINALDEAARRPAVQLRAAVLRQVPSYPAAALAELPLAGFAPITPQLREKLGLPATEKKAP